jgi:predicted alpha/beta hydrolase family esterase
VILVGHSTGGLSVIHAMHEFVDRIKQAFFVAATMLPFGLQTNEDKKDVMFTSFSLFTRWLEKLMNDTQTQNKHYFHKT